MSWSIGPAPAGGVARRPWNHRSGEIPAPRRRARMIGQRGRRDRSAKAADRAPRRFATRAAPGRSGSAARAIQTLPEARRVLDAAALRSSIRDDVKTVIGERGVSRRGVRGERVRVRDPVTIALVPSIERRAWLVPLHERASDWRSVGHFRRQRLDASTGLSRSVARSYFITDHNHIRDPGHDFEHRSRDRRVRGTAQLLNQTSGNRSARRCRGCRGPPAARPAVVSSTSCHPAAAPGAVVVDAPAHLLVAGKGGGDIDQALWRSTTALARSCRLLPLRVPLRRELPLQPSTAGLPVSGCSTTRTSTSNSRLTTSVVRQKTRSEGRSVRWRWDRAISTASRTVSACRATSRTRRGGADPLRARRVARRSAEAGGERSRAARSAFVYQQREDRNGKLGRLTAQESSLFVPLAFHHFLPFAAFSERCARVSRGELLLSLGDLETRAAEGSRRFRPRSSTLCGRRGRL